MDMDIYTDIDIDMDMDIHINIGGRRTGVPAAPYATTSQVWCMYARRMGQPTQRATNYTARSNIEPAQIFLHANGQSAPRSGGARDVGRGAGSHTPSTASDPLCF